MRKWAPVNKGVVKAQKKVKANKKGNLFTLKSGGNSGKMGNKC